MATTQEVQQFIETALKLAPKPDDNVFRLYNGTVPLVTFVPGVTEATRGVSSLDQETANALGRSMQDIFRQLPQSSETHDPQRKRRTVTGTVGATTNGVQLIVQRGTSPEGSYYELIASLDN